MTNLHKKSDCNRSRPKSICPPVNTGNSFLINRPCLDELWRFNQKTNRNHQITIKYWWVYVKLLFSNWKSNFQLIVAVTMTFDPKIKRGHLLTISNLQNWVYWLCNNLFFSNWYKPIYNWRSPWPLIYWPHHLLPWPNSYQMLETVVQNVLLLLIETNF